MIELAEKPLLFPEPELSEFLNRWLPLRQIPDCGPITNMTRFHNRGEAIHQIAPQAPNWPSVPPLNINQLYWPIGATRWARGYFLIDNTTKTALSQDFASTAGMTLKLNNVEFKDIYALQPIPVNALGLSDTKSNQLFILPLVDKRYFWQFRNVSLTITPSSPTTWNDLYGDIGTALGVTISYATVNSNYDEPDEVELTRNYENAGQLLDIIAGSVGQRVICSTDGTVKTENPSDAKTALDSRDNLYPRIAGQKFERANIVDTIDVCFRKCDDEVPYDDGELYVVTKNDGGSNSDNRHTVHTTMWADYVSAALQDSSTLDALAGQIADDFFDWQEHGTNDVFVGIVDPKLNGFDDCAIFTIDHQTEATGSEVKGELANETAVCTRIIPIPDWFGYQLNFSSLGDSGPDTRPKARWIEFHLDEALATTDASCDATVDAYHDGRDPDPSNSGITLYNKSASTNYIFEGSTNDKGEALYSPENNYYIIIQLECA